MPSKLGDMKLASVGLAYLILVRGSHLVLADEGPQSSSSGTSGTVRGVVADPSGAAVPGAAVTIQNPVSHYSQAVKTGSEGKFEFDNVPFNNYHLTISAPGFAAAEKDVDCPLPDPASKPKSHSNSGRRPPP